MVWACRIPAVVVTDALVNSSSDTVGLLLCPCERVAGDGAVTGNGALSVGVAFGELLDRSRVGVHVGVCAIPDALVGRC